MHAVADIAERFGNGELRLTVWAETLLLLNIRTADLEAAQHALNHAGLECKAGTVLSGTVACTGRQRMQICSQR